MCIAAASTQWNSGRLFSITPIVSPRLRPRPARPAASFWTFSLYSAQVIDSSSSFRRIATRSGNSRAVTWKAPQIVDSLSAFTSKSSRAPVSAVAILDSSDSSSPGALARPRDELSHGEAVATQPADVIRQADHEDDQHEHESDHT